METTIFYYTGTGNSLWVARNIAEGLGNAEVVSIVSWMKEKKLIQSEVVGVVFPIHMWGVPPPIISFIKELTGICPHYFFAVGVDAGQVANALIQLKDILLEKDIILDAGFEIKLPSNYIPWGGPGSKEKQSLKFEAARQKISRIIEYVKKREKGHIDKGSLWERVLFTQLYKLSFPQIPKMDRAFWVDEKCDYCGICRMVCPANNITLVEGKPIWKHHCEQCFACLQWCPKEAIQSGKKTPKYERYHNPYLQLEDVLKS